MSTEISFLIFFMRLTLRMHPNILVLLSLFQGNVKVKIGEELYIVLNLRNAELLPFFLVSSGWTVDHHSAVNHRPLQHLRASSGYKSTWYVICPVFTVYQYINVYHIICYLAVCHKYISTSLVCFHTSEHGKRQLPHGVKVRGFSLHLQCFRHRRTHPLWGKVEGRRCRRFCWRSSESIYPLVIWHSHGKWPIYRWFSY